MTAVDGKYLFISHDWGGTVLGHLPSDLFPVVHYYRPRALPTLKTSFEDVLLSFGSFGKGPGEFEAPQGIALDEAGLIFVADTQNSRVQVFTPDGGFIRSLGQEGQLLGQFRHPLSITHDFDDNLIVADTKNHRIQVFDPNDKFLLSFGSRGDGVGQLDAPGCVVVAPDGNYIISDDNHRIAIFTPKGVPVRNFGMKQITREEFGGFYYPVGVAVDLLGNIYVVDRGNDRIQIFDTWGNFLRVFGDTTGGDHPLYGLWGIAVDKEGTIVVVDQSGHKVDIFTNEGKHQMSFGKKGNQLDNPATPVIDREGNVLVVEEGHRVLKYALTQSKVMAPTK